MDVPGLISTDSVAAANAAKASPAAAQRNTLNRDDFLRLLVTQLSNQDPMNPMEGQEFAAQLAQFSSVEQLININEGLTGQADMQGLLAQNINNGVAAGLIGKQVEADGNRLSVSGKGDVPVRFSVDNYAADATVRIMDAFGNLVHTEKLQNLDAGTHDFTWDGKKGDVRQPSGVYTFEVVASDRDGNPVSAAPRMYGHVDRVSFTQGGIQLWMGEASVSMGHVRSVEGEGD